MSLSSLVSLLNFAQFQRIPADFECQIYNSFTNTLSVGHEGINKGDVLMCRCTQNAVVQTENHLLGIVGTDICTAFDERDVIPRSDWVGYQNKGLDGREHSEDGGGVLIGEDEAVWKHIRAGMKWIELLEMEEAQEGI
jgi:hypothetical protein